MGWLVSLFTGGTVKAILDAITEAKRNGDDTRARELEARLGVALAAAQYDRWWSPRSLMGYCVTILVAKLLVWDTVLQLGVTPWPGTLVQWITVSIIGFYFASKSAETIAGVLAEAMTRRK